MAGQSEKTKKGGRSVGIGVHDTIEQGLRTTMEEYWMAPLVVEASDNLDSDFLGRLAMGNVYKELMLSDVSGDEVIEYYYETAEKLARAFGLDWSNVLERHGTNDEYFADAKSEFENIFDDLKLVSDWKKRLAVFDFIGCKLPLLITYAARKIDASKVGTGYEVKVDFGCEREERFILGESHAKMFGIYGNKFEGTIVDGIKVIWPIANRDKVNGMLIGTIKGIILAAREEAKKNIFVDGGLEVLDGIVLIDGGWCYASNTMELSGGSYVYMGMDHGCNSKTEAIEAYKVTFSHELDHLDYMAKRMDGRRQKVTMSGFVMEARGSWTIVCTTAGRREGLVEVDKTDDFDAYGYIMTAGKKVFARDIKDGAVWTTPIELDYPDGRFNNGTWEDWAMIFDVLAAGLDPRRK